MNETGDCFFSCDQDVLTRAIRRSGWSVGTRRTRRTRRVRTAQHRPGWAGSMGGWPCCRAAFIHQLQVLAYEGGLTLADPALVWASPALAGSL